MNTLQVVHSVAKEVIRNLDFWFAPEDYQGEELVSLFLYAFNSEAFAEMMDLGT